MDETHIDNYLQVFIEQVKIACQKYNFDFENHANRAFILKIAELSMSLADRNSTRNAAGYLCYEELLSELIQELL